MEIMDKVNEIVHKVSDKTGEVVEMGKLTAKIHSETDEVTKLKKQIGEICFGKFRAGDELDPEIEQLCVKMEKHKRSIAERQRQLNRMKSGGRQANNAAEGFCPYCGEKLNTNGKFCHGCGKAVQ